MLLTGWLTRAKRRSRSRKGARRRPANSLSYAAAWVLEDRCLPSVAWGSIWGAEDRTHTTHVPPKKAPPPPMPTDPQVPKGSNTPLSDIFWNGGASTNPSDPPSSFIPGINAAPTLKTITIQNTTNQTIYPILRDANTGQDPHNTNSKNPGNYYDPQDFHNQEYRAYIGYVQNGVQFAGLPAHSTITIRVPVVFWDAENTYIATDGKDLFPADPINDSNPFRYDPTSQRGVSLSTDNGSWVTSFTAQGAPSAGLVLFYHATQPLTPSLDAPAQLTEFTIRDPYLNTGGAGTDKGWLTDDAQTSVLFNYDVSYVDNLTSSIAMEASNVPIPVALEPNPPAKDFGWAGSSLIYGTPQQTGSMQALVNDFITNVGPASVGDYFGSSSPGGPPRGWPSYFNPDGILKIPGGANVFANSPLNGQLSSYFTNGPNNQYMLSSGGTGPINVSPSGVPLKDPHPTQLPLSLSTAQRPAFVKNLQAMLAGKQEVDLSLSPDPTVLGKVNSYDPTDSLTSISVTNHGSGYTSAPQVLITGGGGHGAEGIAFVANGQVTGVGILPGKSGSGYTSPPTITLVGGGGKGATAISTIGGGTATVTLNPGVSLPTGVGLTYVFSRPATDYAATAIQNLWYSWAQYYVNQFTTFVPPPPAGGSIAANTNVLALDSVPPGVAVGMTVSGSDGSGIAPAPGTAVTVLGISPNAIKSISVTNGGSGYNPKAPPLVLITGGGGSGASAVAVVTGDTVTGVTIINAGSGYTSAPTISFSGGGGSGAAAGADTGTLIYLSQLSPGGAGTYTFGAPQALPFANADGIKSVVVTNQGGGYTTAPDVNLTGGGGSGAIARAIISKDGHVTAIAIINAGSGYTSAPTISFSGGGGSGAAATASIGTSVAAFPLTFTADQQQTALRFAGSVYEAMAAEAGILIYPTKSPLLPPAMSLVYTTIGCDTADLPNSNGGGSLVGAQVRDLIKSILRGVYDFTKVPEPLWYPNPATWQGGQHFNVYNLDPYVWFVHRVLGLSGYGFSVDDDTADVSAAASNYTPVDKRVLPNNLDIVFSGLGDLTKKNSLEWFLSVHYGTVTDTGTISNPTDGPYAGRTIVTLATTEKYWQIDNPDPVAGQIGAYVSGPGIPPGTVVAAQGDVAQRILILSNHAPDATNVTLKFTGQPPANPILDSGFEQPVLNQKPPANQKANPNGTPWTFNPSSGVAGNGSNFTVLNGPAPEGVQVAYLQGLGVVSQTVNLQPGTYILSFDAAQRQNGPTADRQTIAVTVGGTKVGEVTPSGTNYTAYSVSFTVATAGNYTLGLAGTAATGSPVAFLDAVTLTVKLQ